MPGISVDESIVLTRAAVEAYAREGELVEFLHESFGHWVLGTVYQGRHHLELLHEREFCQTRRTSDARVYFSAMLQRGELPVEPLREYLQALPA